MGGKEGAEMAEETNAAAQIADQSALDRINLDLAQRVTVNAG